MAAVNEAAAAAVAAAAEQACPPELGPLPWSSKSTGGPRLEWPPRDPGLRLPRDTVAGVWTPEGSNGPGRSRPRVPNSSAVCIGGTAESGCDAAGTKAPRRHRSSRPRRKAEASLQSWEAGHGSGRTPAKTGTGNSALLSSLRRRREVARRLKQPTVD